MQPQRSPLFELGPALLGRAHYRDLVLHFYKNTWERETSAEFRLCGYSRVAEPCKEVETEPPKAGEWAGRTSYYRTELEEFRELERALSIPVFLRAHEVEIREEMRRGAPSAYPFADDPRGLRLSQGKYLTACTPTLYDLLRRALSEGDVPGQTQLSTRQQEEFVEGTRRKREAYFFARNPALAREAKRHHGYRCMVCAFVFEATYGEIGREFIECHHLNPLSERRGRERDAALTRLEEVAVLYSKCHRMIHRRRPALSLDELRAALAERTG